MKTKSRQTDFNRTASGIYAQAMEQALSRNDNTMPDKVKHTMLDGGCLLYRVPADYWRKGKGK